MSGVVLERDKAVATVTFNRPESMNALSPQLIRELIELLKDLANDQDLGALILTGAGKAFCAGGDVKAMDQRDTWTFEERYEDLRWKQELAEIVGEFPAIVIGAINGVAMGAGMSLALLCDFRIVAKSASFTAAFGSVGFSGDFGISLSLTRMLGPIKAKELLILNKRLSADDANALGLATKVVDDADLLTEARAFAEQIAAGPRVAQRLMKKNIQAAGNATLMDMLELETVHQTRTAMTEDHREARTARVEKRPPVFKGR